MASQPLTAYALIGLGVHELSVAARSVAVIKQLVRSICVSDAAEAVRSALDATSAAEAEGILRERLVAAVGDAGLLE
jgi:phosphotransferase system enzyme I (PtsI)